MTLALVLIAVLAQESPLTAEEERARFTLAPGFTAELVAADPDISKVVDISFDDAGRMWAVTAVEYPVDANETPAAAEIYATGGRDRVLVFDTPCATGRQVPRTFAAGLALPLTVLPTSDGVLVGQGPDILRLRDTDADGKADQREVVLTGFGVQDSHLMPHRFMRFPGNWIITAQGAFNYSQVMIRSGEVVAFDQTKMARFKPDGSTFEVIGWGLNNIWGIVLDRRGRVFIQEANDQGYPVVPFHLYASYPGIGMHKAKPYSPWQPHLSDFTVGGTGLSGLAHGEAGGFPPPWKRLFFLANPITSRIQTIRHVEAEGRLEKLAPLLVSEDEWFRPIAIHFGPDGCLYVVDWYNKIISHNEVPRDHPERDKTRGRIWRIRHESQVRRPIPNVEAAETRWLPDHLRSENVWEARAAWHQIVDRGAVELVPELERMAFERPERNRRHPQTERRILAIWCLQELGSGRLARLAHDEDPDVRREVVRTLDTPTLLTLTGDPDPEVRLAVIRHLDDVAGLISMLQPPLDGPTVTARQNGEEVLTGAAGLRAFERSRIRAALEERPNEVRAYLATGAGRALDVEQRLLAWLAVGGREGALRVAETLGQLRLRSAGKHELALLGEHAGDPEVARALGERLDDVKTQAAVLTLLIDSREVVSRQALAAPIASAARALVTREPTPASWSVFLDAASAFAIAELEPELLAYARAPERTRQEQAQALRALIEIESGEAELFASLARGCLPGEELQSLAAVALAGCDDEEAFALLLAMWPDCSSAVQRLAVRKLATSAIGSRRLLAAVEAGDVEGTALDPVSMELFMDTLGDDPALARVRDRQVTQTVLVLDGATEDYLPANLTLAGPFTVETWIKLEPGISNADGILAAPEGADFNFAGARFRVYAGREHGDKIVAERSVEPERWTHLAVTRDDADDLLIYMNGELDPARGSWNGAFTELDVGRTIPGAGTDGVLTEFRVWNVARTAQEIGASFRRSVEQHPALVFRFPDPKRELVPAGDARIERSADVPELLDEASAQAQARQFARYRGLAAGPGDVAAGRAVFERDCARCHTVGGEGGQIGPVLDGAGAMGTESLLRALLTPNSAVESGYRTLLVRTTDGKLFDGFLASQDEEQLVLRKPDVEDQLIPRTEIESAWFDRLSVMPEDLLKALTDGEVRDLFAYLSSLE